MQFHVAVLKVSSEQLRRSEQKLLVQGAAFCRSPIRPGLPCTAMRYRYPFPHIHQAHSFSLFGALSISSGSDLGCSFALVQGPIAGGSHPEGPATNTGVGSRQTTNFTNFTECPACLCLAGGRG